MQNVQRWPDMTACEPLNSASNCRRLQPVDGRQMISEEKFERWLSSHIFDYYCSAETRRTSWQWLFCNPLTYTNKLCGNLCHQKLPLTVNAGFIAAATQRGHPLSPPQPPHPSPSLLHPSSLSAFMPPSPPYPYLTLQCSSNRHWVSFYSGS